MRKRLNDEQRRLVSENIGLAGLVVKKTRSLTIAARLEYEDVYAIACEGLVKGALRFDASKGRPGSYLYSSAQNAVLMACRETRLKRRSAMQTVSLEAPFAFYAGDPLYLSDLLEDKAAALDIERVTEPDNADRLWEHIGRMSDQEQRIVRLCIAGKTQTEIAGVLGCSQPHVSRLMKKIRTELEAVAI